MVTQFSALGIWGFIGMVLGLVMLGYIPVKDFELWSYSPTPPWVVEDAIDGLIMIVNNPLLMVAIGGTILSIAFFNFAGLTVTQQLTATTRMVLDSVRTFVIWMFSLAVGWQKFQYLQIIGFILLLTGMALYNDLLILPAIRSYRSKKKAAKL